MQVRQPLYKSSVGRWKAYEQQLAGLEQRLAPLIARYEKLLQTQMAARGGPLDAQHAQHDAAATGGADESKGGASGRDASLPSTGEKDEL
jgi:hypothetical protein